MAAITAGTYVFLKKKSIYTDLILPQSRTKVPDGTPLMQFNPRFVLRKL